MITLCVGQARDAAENGIGERHGLTDVRCDGVAPDEVPLARQMQAVVGVTFVEKPRRVRQTRGQVDVDDAAPPAAQRLDEAVRLGDLGLALPVAPRGAGDVAVVDRQDALHVDARAGRGGGEAVEQRGHVGGHLAGRAPGGQVVDPDHEEELARTAREDRVEAAEQPIGAIAADAAVEHAAAAEELRPLAAVGDAVAQEDDVAPAHRQLLEKAAALVIVCALREGGGGEQQGRRKKKRAFHWFAVQSWRR